MKDLAREVFLDTLRAVDVERVLRQRVERRGDVLKIGELEFNLNDHEAVAVIALGKAAIKMALSFAGAARVPKLVGVVATNQEPDPPMARILTDAGLQIFRGGHPAPNDQSVAAASQILSVLQMARESWLVVFLISGGGSAIVEKPIDDSIGLEDLRILNHLLVTSGATIAEMNIVRKHFSAIKGGRLALATKCKNLVSLYISDTNVEDLASIASGPTLPDDSTWVQVRSIIARSHLELRLPHSIRVALAGSLPETPKPAELTFDRSRHMMVLSNADAVAAAARSARAKGIQVTLAQDLVEGDYREMAREHLHRLADRSRENPEATVCLISGGEVSCRVHGEGVGGRNQEFVLYSTLIAEKELGGLNWVVLSAGTDGIDGNSPAAGAVADSTTLARAMAANLDPHQFLERNDSYNFFRQLGDAIVTGSTGSNVRDVRILLGSPQARS